MNKMYGIFFKCSNCSCINCFFSNYIPLGGAVAIAIIIGAIVGNSISISDKFNSGITFSEKKHF